MTEIADRSLSPQYWYGISVACVRNGRALLEDAELLLEHGRSPRALSLAVLATEEFGKALQAFAVLLSGGGADEIKGFRRFGRDHASKLEAAETWMAVAHPHLPLDESLTQNLIVEVERRSARKMAGLYVDHTPEGILQPDRITLDEATECVRFARTVEQLLCLYSLPNLTGPEVDYLWSAGPAAAMVVKQVADGAENVEALFQGLVEALEAGSLPTPPSAPRGGEA